MSRLAHPERIVPDDTPLGVVALHLRRYAFAAPFCLGGDVLDAACGVGYGTAHLAQEARNVLGIDVDTETIEYARVRYALPNVRFDVMDLHELDLPGESFDTVVSFETIEHVAEPEAALSELARVLRSGGALVVSTPNARISTRTPANPHHLQEWSPADFETFLRRNFDSVELYGQWRPQTRAHRIAQRLDVLGFRRRFAALRRAGRVLGTASTEELTLDDIVIEPGALDRATEIVAVCRAPRGR